MGCEEAQPLPVLPPHPSSGVRYHPQAGQRRHRHHLHCELPIVTSPYHFSTSAGIDGIAATGSAAPGCAVAGFTIAGIETTDCFATASSPTEKTGKDLQRSDSRQ